MFMFRLKNVARKGLILFGINAIEWDMDGTLI